MHSIVNAPQELKETHTGILSSLLDEPSAALLTGFLFNCEVVSIYPSKSLSSDNSEIGDVDHP